MIVFPNCKINLGLQVRRKRTDGYHDLETIFYPVPVEDALEVVQVNGKGTLEFSSSGREVTATAEDNICYKAYLLLRERFPDLPSVQMHLHKVIPSGAGLGGGSADGAFTLLLLNRKLSLNLTETELADLALQLGSDCPFFIYNKPCFASGRGEALSPLGLSLAGYTLLLIHPGIHVPTAAAFRNIRPDDNRPGLQSVMAAPPDRWPELLQNNFENSVFIQYPELMLIKEKLYQMSAVYASMSGSGSAIYGLFAPGQEVEEVQCPESYFVRKVVLQ